MIKKSHSLLVNTEDWEGEDCELAQCRSRCSFSNFHRFEDVLSSVFTLPLLQTQFLFHSQVQAKEGRVCLSTSIPVPLLRAVGAAEVICGLVFPRSLTFLLLHLPAHSKHMPASCAALFHGGCLRTPRLRTTACEVIQLKRRTGENPSRQGCSVWVESLFFSPLPPTLSLLGKRPGLCLNLLF